MNMLAFLEKVFNNILKDGDIMQHYDSSLKVNLLFCRMAIV